MTIKITPLYVDNPLQNYIWVITNDETREAVAIDPTSSELVQQYMQENGLNLRKIWVTHDHFDHIAGVAVLKSAYPNAAIYAHAQHELLQGCEPDVLVGEGDCFDVWGCNVSVWSLEGHKRHHLGYVLMLDGVQRVFSGDIIFKAGCGRVFMGTVDELYDSLQRIAGLSDESVIYPTHEFTVKNLEFALTIEPDSAVLHEAMRQAQALRRQNKPTLPTTVGEEKRINPFLRVHEVEVVRGVQREAGIKDAEPRAVFAALRGLKDEF